MADSSQTAGQWIDVTVPLREGLPTWPNSVGIRVHTTMSLDRGEEANVTRLDFDIHVGTHVETPRHFLPDGWPVDKTPIDHLIGPALVVHVPDVKAVTAGDLDALNIPQSTQRLLIRTSNGPLWKQSEFDPTYVSLTLDAAEWVARRGIKVIGIDYLSIQKYGDSFETHRVLMRANILIIEGLVLSAVPAGLYEMICLPLLLAGAEAAPARVLLRPMTKTT